MNIVYRVVLKVGYYQTFFQYETADEATALAEKLLKGMVDSEDQKQLPKITLEIVNLDREEHEDD